MKRFSVVAVLAAVCSLAIASVSSSSASSRPAAASKATGKLVIDNESGSTWTCQFNPFNPAVVLTTFGFIYEPLEFVDILASSSSQ